MRRILFYTTLLCSSFVWNGGGVCAQIITTVAGNNASPAFGGDGGPATAAGLAGPNGIAIDPTGNIYISDHQTNRVRKVNIGDTISTYVGTGVAGYSGDGGPSSSAQLSDPLGLLCDAIGNLYIAEAGYGYVRKVNSSGIITTIAGNGTFGFSGDGGPATAAAFKGPTALAMDDTGNIYIADYANHRVRKINLSGIITTIAGNGVAGYAGDGGAATAAAIQKPIGLACDKAGNLYITQGLNNVIRRVDQNGTITTFAGNATQGFSGDGGPATSAQLYNPGGIVTDAAGNVFFSDSDNNRIRKIDAGGIITTIAGNGIYGYGGDGGLADTAELSAPEGLTFDNLGNLYIVDAFNYVVRKVTNVGQIDVQQISPPTSEVLIYPNPAENVITIHYANESSVTLDVFDAVGSNVKTQLILYNKVDVSDLPAGVYYFKIKTGRVTQVKKILKK